MIQVVRGPLPDSALAARAADATKLLLAAQATYATDRPKVDLMLRSEFAPYVRATFDSKCAFCESAIPLNDYTRVKHFRPITDALQVQGQSSRLHYYWLAYEWTNLYLICATCDKNKGTLFPVSGERAPLNAVPVDAQETALLLDPCRADIDPFDFLMFHPDGTVAPAALTPAVAVKYTEHPGAVTIQVFGLNRSDLVQRRRSHAQFFVSEVQKLELEDPDALDQYMAKQDPTEPYRAVTISLVRSAKEELERSRHTSRAVPVIGYALAAAVARTTQRARPVRARRKTISMSDAIETRALCVTKVTIENFYAIDALEISLSPEERTWKMLLGENATGKTTVLKAIALALMGKRFALQRFRADGGNWLRRQGGTRAGSGSISVQLSTSDPELRLTFNAGRLTFSGDLGGAPTCVRAYGAVRLPGTSGRTRSHATSRPKDATNLWDPAYRLPSVRDLLKNLRPAQRKPARLLIADLLGLEASAVSVRHGDVNIELHDTRISVDDLSAGYADVLNVAVDLLANVPSDIGDMRNAFGVVLVDELGAHLHPRWKMQIVSSLKNVFPKIQFVATTHDPLCLRDLDAHEIVVMERNGPRVYPVLDLPSPREMRVDQLLTSRFFGLGSTIDQRLDKDFQRYYELLSNEHRNADETLEYGELKARLNDTSALGFTRRDQILYELIDEFLAHELRAHRQPDKETATHAASGSRLPDDLKNRVRESWRRLTKLGDSA